MDRHQRDMVDQASETLKARQKLEQIEQIHPGFTLVSLDAFSSKNLDRKYGRILAEHEAPMGGRYYSVLRRDGRVLQLDVDEFTVRDMEISDHIAAAAERLDELINGIDGERDTNVYDLTEPEDHACFQEILDYLTVVRDEAKRQEHED